MGDLIVKLYDLPALDLSPLQKVGVTVRRALPPERIFVCDWVERHFSTHWRAEVEVGFGSHPLGVFIARDENGMLGFSCADVTARGFFGPTGVAESARGQGIGKALLLIALHDLFARGHAYGIIGAPGPVEFYTRLLDAVEFPDSDPGIYKGQLK